MGLQALAKQHSKMELFCDVFDKFWQSELPAERISEPEEQQAIVRSKPKKKV